MRVFIPSKLSDGDLFFSSLKRQYESIGTTLVSDSSKADILINSSEITREDQRNFLFGDKKLCRKVDFCFEFEEVDKSIEIIETLSELKKIKQEIDLYEKIAVDLKRVNSLNKNNFTKVTPIITELSLFFLSQYIDRDRVLNLNDICNSIKEISTEHEEDCHISKYEIRDGIPETGILIEVEEEILFIQSNSVEVENSIALIILTLFEKKDALVDSNLLDWDKILKNILYPIVLFDESSSQLILHSNGFSRLKIMLRDCLELKNGQTIELEGQIYEAVRFEVNIDESKYIAIAFNTKEKVDKLISSEELGIISSSLAHELNNPIAGILASLQLLKLEDGLDEETQKVLEEMDEGTKRCQGLIQVFLGFSRATPGMTTTCSMSQSFLSALNMLRFRMVESDTIFNLEEIHSSESFNRQINSSIMTMIYYLFFNEVLTLHSHYQLVKDENIKTVNGKIKEYSDRVYIAFPDLSIKKIGQKVNDLKLVQHLLSIAGLSMIFEEERIVIREKK